MNLPSSDARIRSREVEALLARALDEGRLPRAPAQRLGANLRDPAVLAPLLRAAYASKLAGKGTRVTVSRNLFIPLTNLCRNQCGYCTFAKPPQSPEAKTYSLDEVTQAVRRGVLTGCIEALMCLGDKPELAHRAHRDWLASHGYRGTVDHLIEACRVAFEGGMLPHTNAGILSPEELEALRPWNVSMGLMLESTSQRLCAKGMPHQYSPDKDPVVRLRMHEHAGQLKIPLTSGILLGIGESATERVDTLLAIRELDDRYGHIQETIVQPFHPKPGTRMRAAPPLHGDEIVGWVAMSRLILGPTANVQTPPNLMPDLLEQLLRSGLNDLGGISPVTLDFINPEAPWPTLRELRRRTESVGQFLVERLPVYPEWVNRDDFFDPQVRAALPRFADDAGLARCHTPRSGEEAACA